MNAQDSRKRKSLVWFGVSALLAVGAATAQVATGTTGIDASGSYQQEVQACLSGQTQQDRDTCLKEARNAQADKRRGLVEAHDRQELAANATARCHVHPAGEDRAACEARVMGMGHVEGSVAGGGLLRQVETVVLPEGAAEVAIDARTDSPVLLAPTDRTN